MAQLSDDLRDSGDTRRRNEQPEILKWAYRSLWLLLFLALMVTMGQWDKVYTWTFLGAVLSMLLTCLFTKEEEWQQLDVHFCTSVDTSEHE